MDAVAWIVVWGTAALFAAIMGGVMAKRKNRAASPWIAWCFVLPPLVLLLWLLPRQQGPPVKVRSLDEEDRGDDLDADAPNA